MTNKSLHLCETIPQSIPFSDARCKEDYEESHVITSKKGPKVCTLITTTASLYHPVFNFKGEGNISTNTCTSMKQYLFRVLQYNPILEGIYNVIDTK